MNRISSPLRLALLFASVAVAGPEAGPLKVTAILPPGPHFVGQAIEVRVAVEGGPGPPTVEGPRTPGAEVRALPQDRSRPSVARFLLVAGRPGVLDLPPFRARSGDRAGASRSTRLSISNVPAEGRTSAFLGGVGSFEVRADAEPSSVRSGQTLIYRVRVMGAAAWGSVRPPDLGEWASPTLRVETLPDTLEAGESPARTFRYKIRLLGKGRVVLPPVTVSSLDPRTKRYATRATSGVPVLVEETPRFDPSRLDYRPAGRSREDQRSGLPAVGLALSLVAMATAGLWFFSKRAAKAGRVDPRTLALELAGGLAEGVDEVIAARAVTEALTTFLQRVDGRTPGALTPPELREALERMTSDRDLASLAEALLVRCDRARYGRSDGDASGLIAEGREVFKWIGEPGASEGRGA